MDTAVVKLVRDAMSAERLASYEDASGDDVAGALRLYAWNIEISAAFYGPLGCLEILLRNALHREMTAHFGCSDWWNHPHVGLTKVAVRKVAEARDELVRHHKQVAPDRMVAEFSFGFWVSLLGSGGDYERRLWRPALHRAFPEYRGLRKPLHRHFDHLRVLRNRIAHHEPIYRRHLEMDHRRVLQLIGYISPETADCVRRNDRVPEVLARRADVCSGVARACF